MVVRVLYQVDAFTSLPFSGNPAGVVLAADGLTDNQMLAVARELTNSETAFVLAPDGPGHDVRIRFFTPTTEVPTCGHATVAARFARAVEYGLPAGSLVQKSGTGLRQRVRIHRDGDRLRIGMHQGAAVFGPELDGSATGRLLHALGAAPGTWRTAARCRSSPRDTPKCWSNCATAPPWTDCGRTRPP